MLLAAGGEGCLFGQRLDRAQRLVDTVKQSESDRCFSAASHLERGRLYGTVREDGYSTRLRTVAAQPRPLPTLFELASRNAAHSLLNSHPFLFVLSSALSSCHCQRYQKCFAELRAALPHVRSGSQSSTPAVCFVSACSHTMAGGSSVSGTVRESSQLATFQNLVKPFIGAGILALPYAFHQGGLLASVTLMALMALMANYCIRCLLHCLEDITHPDYQPPRSTATAAASSSAASNPLLSEQLVESSRVSPASLYRNPYSVLKPPSFRDIGYIAYGNVGKYAVDVSLILSQLGFCTAYMAFMGTNLHAVWPAVQPSHYTLLMMTALIVMCQIRQVAHIAFTSALGNLIYIVSLTIIFVDGAQHACCLDGADKTTREAIPLFRLAGLPFVFGTACFALEGIGLILPVKAAMRAADQPRFYGLLNGAVLLVATCYVVFGTMGVLFYGSSLKQDGITGNLTVGIASDAVRVSLCVSLFFSYILQLFPVVDITDYAVWCLMRSKEDAEREEWLHTMGPDHAEADAGGSVNGNSDADHFEPDKSAPLVSPSGRQPPPPAPLLSPQSLRHLFSTIRTPNLAPSAILVQCVVRALCVAFTAFIAIVVSNFGFVVALTGSLANSLIAFILPALFYLRLVVYVQHPHPLAHGWSSLRPYILPVAVVVSGITASVIGVETAIVDELRSSSSSG